MPDKKLTDAEIVKALECCKNDGIICFECPYKKTNGCMEKLSANALDLINRLQEEKQNLEIELKAMRGAANSYKAENESLIDELETTRNYIHDNNLEYDLLSYSKIKTTDWLIKGISKEQLEQEKIQVWKAEAYKECIEKVKEISKYETYCDNRLPAPIITYHITEDKLNNLSKELVGDK